MSSMIYDPFLVTNLPRLPPKSDVSKLCLTSQLNDANSSNFDISISGSYLSTFITRPSPKMIWSYALSPQAIVTSMDSFDSDELNSKNSINNSNTDLFNDKKIFAIGITERKKHKLKFITYGVEDEINFAADDENQSSSMSVVNEEDRNTNELENIKEVKDCSISVKKQIVGLKFSKNLKFIYSLYANGTISVWKFSIDSNENEKELLKHELASKKSKIIFHKFIKPEELKVNSRSDKLDYLLMTVETTNDDNKIIIRIFSLDTNEILEISNSTIENNVKIDKIQFTYDISGKLVILENDEELTIKSFELPLVNNKHVLKIGGVFKHEPNDSPTSIMCASTNRILVSKGSTVALIDTQYESLLSSLDLYSRSKEQNGNVKPARHATLLNVPTVAGNTLRSRKTFALLVLKNTKENYSQIQHVSIDVGLGKLRDSLGKSLPSYDIGQNESFTSFPAYFVKSEQTLRSKVSDEVAELNERVLKSNEELSIVYNKLKKIKESGDLKLLESNMIAYLKNRALGDLFDDDDYKVYEYEKDRFVDPKFFKLLTLLLFNHNTKTDLLSLDEEYIPENGLTYLLTHPLFPNQYSSGLLNVLEISPRLQRQAIVTCVNIPCFDLILELSRVENDEIFKDIIIRLIDEFSAEEITQETIKIMKKKLNTSINFDSNFDLDKIITKIIQLNFGYEVLNSFIDSNGLVLSLHYSNDQSQLDNLIKQTQFKVESLIEDTQLLTLINQALSNTDKENSNNNKKKNKKKSNVQNGSTFTSDVKTTQDIEVEMNKLDMMLNVGGKDSQFTKNVVTKVSPYTIDKLNI